MRKIRKKKNNNLITVLVLFIIIIFIPIIIYKDSIINYIDTYKSAYSKETIKVLKENNKFKEINTKKYSKTLDEIINTDHYDSKYLESYIEIDYHEDDKFLENITSLLNIGYSSNDINQIYSKLKKENVDIIINNKYVNKITDILNLSYFKESLLNRYITYYNTHEYNYIDAITYVNIGLDNNYYTNVINIDNQDDLNVLVNKYHTLDDDYVPTDLVDVKENYRIKANKLKKVANNNFEKMADNARNEGIILYVGSGYRSYDYQKSLYNYYVSVDGQKEADTYSARPGYSEHQTGLAIDISNRSYNFIEDNSKEYNWLINNSYKYGFILRYPKGNEWITGYIYEPWHYRYVGENIAKYIKDNNLTYDEYIARK